MDINKKSFEQYSKLDYTELIKIEPPIRPQASKNAYYMALNMAVLKKSAFMAVGLAMANGCSDEELEWLSNALSEHQNSLMALAAAAYQLGTMLPVDDDE